MKSSVDWETDIYSKGCQLNRWPFDEVVSSVMRASTGRPRGEIDVLEIGCGVGNNIWFLATEGFKAHGIDSSSSAISYAKQRMETLGLEADLSVGSIADLPWGTGVFDMVIDRGALTQNTHQDVAKAIEEARRVLKVGGVMMSFTLFGMNYPGRLFGMEVGFHTFDHFSDGYFRSVGLTSFFTKDDLTNLFGRFAEIKIERTTVHDCEDRISSEVFRVFAVK
jgi:ubiquinone/menaquinone biosynthesis C-methylase UbiE